LKGGYVYIFLESGILVSMPQHTVCETVWHMRTCIFKDFERKFTPFVLFSKTDKNQG
jgi:hypothetical protein